MQFARYLAQGKATTEEQRALYAEQVGQLYSNGRLGLLASAINALVLAVIQRDVTSHTNLVLWVVLLAAVSLLRYSDIRLFWRRSPETSEAARWGRRFIVGLALSGMVWGSSAILLFPGKSLAHQTFLAFVIGGMVAGAAGAFSSEMKAFLAYSVPALGPIIVRFGLLGDEFHLAMAGMALLFGLMMFLVAKQINTVRFTSVKLHFENNDLELRVEKRTEELRKAYENLQKETGEREQAESQLRQAQKMEALGTLAGGVAHDFNNILAAMMGFSELARDAIPADSKARRDLKRVLDAGLRGRDLVRQILTFSRKTEVERKVVSLTPLVKETLTMLRASLPATIQLPLTITTNDDYVFADPIELQQIIMNLASNAAHAMQEAGGELSIELSSASFTRDSLLPDPEMEPGDYVKLTVKDTGTGMTEEVRKRIFEPFFTTRKQGMGTGMGLAVVYGVVKAHGGAVTVQSGVGQGSTFEVFLPRAQREKPKQEEIATSALPTGTERILFVDDENWLVEAARRVLEHLGYHVTVAQNASEAWDLFLEDPWRFDLVITDQAMPGITGMALAQKMLVVREEMSIILCTGYSETVSAEKARGAGIRAFAMKPLVTRELAEIVRRVLDGRRTAA